ncbi:MAG: pyridoxamine 5'-phosphate oxidase family protein [Dehalococcoidia bacterium]|nr:pyridoxamine 5'-phosphate oxidase family protein [Dehalococcoidia bacterium]
MAAGAKDHETVSIYPLDERQREELLTTASECSLNWSTSDGWPVGVIHSFVWKDGRAWITAGAHRHRIAAIRRNPKVSVVVSSAASKRGPGQSLTLKGRAVVHEDRETKDWFYPALAYKGLSGPAAEDFVQRLNSPLRVIIEVIPEKWITFDGAKMAMDTMGTLPDDQRGPMLESDAVRLQREIQRRGLD